MWGAISRLFVKQDSKGKLIGNDNDIIESMMDKSEPRKSKEREVETHESRLAKQRATLKWMLLKAFNNKVPESLKEPFYKDHEGVEHVKPQVVHYLASAELYCMALSNIYCDPNYNSLNHTGVIQALARKGVCLSDPHVTETTLIQTTPIKLSVHQTVMQGVMMLYTREVVTPELVAQAVNRFLPASVPSPPVDHERALLLWINKAVKALKLRVEHSEAANESEGKSSGAKLVELSSVNDLSELCDGAALATLVAFYCPEVVDLRDISIAQLPTISDCIHNLTLVQSFCANYLPADIFLMQPEEIYYMRGSMRHNLIVFLADLFNMLEINPAKCVTIKTGSSHLNEGRNSQGVLHKRSFPQVVSGIPDLRSSLDTPSTFSGSPVLAPATLRKPNNSFGDHSSDNRNGGGGDEEFVVHRGRGITTLSSIMHQQYSTSGSNAGAEMEPAGKPTNWGDHRKQSFAGRRSRRNSLSEDSQLTLENLCGSQENLHLLGRNPDKEPAVLRGGTPSNGSPTCVSVPEAPPRRSLSRANSWIESQKRAEESRSSAGVQQTLLEPSPPPSPRPQLYHSNSVNAGTREHEKERKTTTFAVLPSNTTTWQSISSQASSGHHSPSNDNGIHETADNGAMNSQLINVRLKLEEKRRRIESEKKRMEAQLNRQRQKLGKEAFLQAISKGGKPSTKSPESDPGKEVASDVPLESAKMAPRPFSLQDISEVEQKWLKGDIFIEERKTPDIENMDIESYQRSIAQMDSSLHEIQADLQRLSFEQNQMGGMPPPLPQQPPPLPQQPPPLPQQPPPQLQSFASLHSQPTYNNINYISNIPPSPNSHHQEFNNSMTQHNMYNTMQQQPGYQQNYQQQFNRNMGYASNASPFHQQSSYQQQYHQQQSSPLPPIPPHHQHQQHQLNSHYADSRYNNPEVQNIGRQQWHQVNSSNQHQMSPQQTHYENYSPRYGSEAGYGAHGGSSLGSESGYGGSKGGDDCSSISGGGGVRKGEFYLHEPSPSHRSRWAPPSSPPNPGGDQPPPWLLRERRSVEGGGETVSLSSSPSTKGHAPIENGTGSDLGYKTSPPSLAPPTPPPRTSNASSNVPQSSGQHYHAPVQPPPPDDMEPQSISFIGTGEDEVVPGLKNIQITSGSRTYRVSSPTKGYVPIAGSKGSSENREQGFYISFDDDSPYKQPARPKPPLRTKRNSPKKERGLTQTLESCTVSKLVTPEGKEVPGFKVGNDNAADSSSQASPRLPPVVHHFNASSSLHQNHQSPPQMSQTQSKNSTAHNAQGDGLIIGAQPDPVTLDEMERKKERIVLMSLQRRQAAEDSRLRKEAEAAQRREFEKMKQDERNRKKEEDRRRRETILEQHKIKKAIEEAEREGKQVDKELLNCLKARLPSGGGMGGDHPKVRMRQQPPLSSSRPRPKTVHMDSDLPDSATLSSARNKKGSTSNLSALSHQQPRPMRRDYYRGSQDCLTETRRPPFQHSATYNYSDVGDESRGTSPGRTLARRSSYKTSSRDPSPDVRSLSRTRGGRYTGGGMYGTSARKSTSLMNLASATLSGSGSILRHGGSSVGDIDMDGMSLGRGTRAGSPSGPGSLPLRPRRVTSSSAGSGNHYDDTASEAGSDYSGPRLYRQPTTKSNKGIIINAIEYCVFPGMVNKEAKRRVLEEVNRAEAKHLLVLFRDAGCQFRALYVYHPDTEEVLKLYGTGPKQVTDRMFDKFFKYNSGGKCFSQVHTKHLTVTIDAFTIHNSLWQGKKVNLPSKADMTLVI